MWPLKSHSSKSRTKVQYITVHYSTLQHNTVQYSTIHYRSPSSSSGSWPPSSPCPSQWPSEQRSGQCFTELCSAVQYRLAGLLFCSRKLFSIRYRNILWVVSSLAFVYLNLYLVQQSPVPPSHHFPELDTQWMLLSDHFTYHNLFSLLVARKRKL